jgi:hypothetical protein
VGLENPFIETPWETRNLGIPSFAIDEKFYAQPRLAVLKSGLDDLACQHNRFFVYTRIPKQQLVVTPILSECGFYLVECAFTPFLRLSTSPVLARFEKSPAAFLPERYPADDVAYVQLERGPDFPAQTLCAMAAESFSDDRFHVDHACPKETADQRFSFWMQDLIADPGVVFDGLRLKGELIGFIARKKNFLSLTGFAKRYVNAGLGEFFWLSTCQVLQKANHLTVETLISANNLPTVNLYTRLGFKFKDTQYSFHYWGQRL